MSEGMSTVLWDICFEYIYVYVYAHTHTHMYLLNLRVFSLKQTLKGTCISFRGPEENAKQESSDAADAGQVGRTGSQRAATALNGPGRAGWWVWGRAEDKLEARACVLSFSCSWGLVRQH